MESKTRSTSLSVLEADFAELEDGSRIELIEDPEDSSRTAFAVFNGKETRYTRECECKGHLLVPVPRDGNIVRHVRFPRGAKPFESVESILGQLDSIFSQCIDLRENYRSLLTAFVLSTWFVDRLPIAPYVALVGLPRSGKSTVLKLLSLLCRRSLLTADISSAAFYRACDRLTPTLLIDETGTAGDRKKLFHLLRTGISRDVVALRKDQSFSAFGPKVVSWTELPNDAALNSRCITIPMHETRRSDLKRPTDPDIRATAEDLQAQMLQCRLEKFRALRLPEITQEEPLYSRSKDLYEALALPIGECRNACQNLLDYFTRHHQVCGREPLYPPHAAVLEFLYCEIHEWFQPRGAPLHVREITHEVNEFLKNEGEHFRLNPRQVGAALTALGFLSRKRTRTGWTLLLDRQDKARIHDLINFYGRDHYRRLIPREGILNCEFCANSEDPETQGEVRLAFVRS
jgi:hypothetical protein